MLLLLITLIFGILGVNALPQYTGGYTDSCDDICSATWKTCGRGLPLQPSLTNVQLCWSVYEQCLATHCQTVESPRTLGVTMWAFNDIKGKTEVFYDVNALVGSTVPPAIVNGRVRDYTPHAVLYKTNTFRDVTLRPFYLGNGRGSAIFSGYSLYDWLESKLQFSCSSFSTITCLAQVRNAPDLAVDPFTLEPTVTLGSEVTVNVQVRELNGEFGARANLRLYRVTSGGVLTQLDTTTVIDVVAGGSQTVIFKFTPEKKGGFTVMARVEDFSQKDYNPDNNSQKMSTQVVEAQV
jgi:hypothetical protein